MIFTKFILLTLSILFLLTGCNENENANTNQNINISRTSISQINIENSSYTVPELEPTYTEIATYTSKILDKMAERQNNVSITSSKLNDTIVEVGQEFSFCNTVGRATTKDGYQEAIIFDSEGNKKKGLGGGNCQVSSTLYNAVLNVPGLDVVERHEHSRDVYYVPEGKDASVAYGSNDFRFVNNTATPIRINVTHTPDELTVKLYKIENNV